MIFIAYAYVLTGKKIKENCTYLVFNFIDLKIKLAKLFIGIDNSCVVFDFIWKTKNFTCFCRLLCYKSSGHIVTI